MHSKKEGECHMLHKKEWLYSMAKVTFLSIVFSNVYAQSHEREDKQFDEISGVIETIDSQALIVRSGTMLYEFPLKDSQLEIPIDVEPGDEISVAYTLKMNKIKIRKFYTSHFLRSNPSHQPGGSVILDDRAFFDA